MSAREVIGRNSLGNKKLGANMPSEVRSQKKKVFALHSLALEPSFGIIVFVENLLDLPV